MVKKIGRLSRNEKNEIYEEIHDFIDQFKKSNKTAEKKLNKLVNCPNYFGREFIASYLAKSPIANKLKSVMKKLLDSKEYPVRATALFFFYNYYASQPEKMIDIVSEYFDSIKWEAENIIDIFWKSNQKLMKKNMLKWIESPDERKRSLSFHGLENLCYHDPQFVLEFIEKIIDDESIEVQKKITHTIIQVARVKPAIVYPYIREWLVDADEKRQKTIWVSMTKLVNSLHGLGAKERSKDFVMLTKETIKNWKFEKNRKISKMGSQLSELLYSKKKYR
ncbi:MAG: DNA alkylation repair protein [Candidatus Cloacimonadota bacterium]|nr:DNA alkylation repair protein [Candidatus Cloacimonadota bacterium]